ncbi:MAG: restriction endonuclease subunit S [Candidatus Thiodiazotropha endolucinida]|nr:restriction endonuclease subunit S [Candidatus Thiodiazotropha sp. (ex Lucina pensylvanica)]MCG8022952.1 restriction endonuclease subunit S [Candidatus Thiodiazotropha endolucinida]
MRSESIVGEIPAHWEKTNLGELCERTGGNIQTGPFGSQLHASDYVPVGIPSIMPVNIGDNRIVESGIVRITETDAERLSKYRVRDGDIVYSRRGDVERRALVTPNEEGWLCGTGCLRVRPGEGMNSEFISYQLGHPAVRAWIVQHAVGATMPNLNTKILSALPVVVPPVAEQSEIAATLGAIDDKIANNRALATDLEAMARAIFKSWFVDFDPVKAKMEGRPPSGMDADTAALFPNALVESELGLIPEGWTSSDVAGLLELSYGKALKATDRVSGDVPVYGSGGITGWHNTALVNVPTVVVGRKGSVGTLYWEDRPSFPIDTVFFVKPKTVSLSYCYFLLANLPLTEMNTDAAVPGLNRNNVYRLGAVQPSSKVLAAWDQICDPIRSKIVQLEAESADLSKLRDTLLPRLISGKLPLPVAPSEAESPPKRAS